MGLQLVTFAPAHFPVLRDWFTSDREVVTFGGSGLRYPLDDGQLQAIVDDLDRRSWMAVSDHGEIVGHVELLLERATSSALLGRVGIAPDARGGGLGTVLVSRALEAAWAVSWITRVHLNVYASNAPAMAVYRRLGFASTGPGADSREVDGETWPAVGMSLARPAAQG